MKPLLLSLLLAILCLSGNNILLGNNRGSAGRMAQSSLGENAYLTTIDGSMLLPISTKVDFSPKVLGVMTVTAYSSSPDETDSTPFITASNKRVGDGIVAYNCLPFGTRITMPDLFGGKIFVVEDRMNKKWGCDRIDVWMDGKSTALEFGIKKSEINIIE